VNKPFLLEKSGYRKYQDMYFRQIERFVTIWRKCQYWHFRQILVYLEFKIDLYKYLFCINPAGVWVATHLIGLLTGSNLRCANPLKLAVAQTLAGFNAPLR
jgi:hypothetical protein